MPCSVILHYYWLTSIDTIYKGKVNDLLKFFTDDYPICLFMFVPIGRCPELMKSGFITVPAIGVSSHVEVPCIVISRQTTSK